ncbi:alpha-2,8-sialyltransferase 8E-like [Acanthaster planci]|uniref:Alpha-2,8-sialyltransferase 8E-like n=1 Tax=Acanthaster planci TaxID=133434 RepID=A0A8B7YKS0_ACAPL|nr:alpha-2,8-sialyltransferase 8E-like [Acanthaster planci]
MKQDWKPDVAKTREFRADIRTELGKAGSPGNFLLTKNNTSPRAKMRFYMAGKARNMTPSLWSYLPQNAIFKQGQFASCSVVGSSGILRGSRCGKKIDQSQFVSRFNLAAVWGYETDVGSQTNFTTLNPSFVANKLNGLKTQTNCSHFGNILKQFKDSKLWLPMFGASVYFSTLKRTMVTATEFQSVQPVLGHPDHFLSVSKLWRKTIGNNRLWPTTGLYLVLSLVDVCDRINVFGFWPYSTTINGSDVPYHYHNDVTGKKNLHSFDTEFKTLVNLYEKGIINMHFGACL